MNTPLSPTIVSALKGLILETFEVSAEEARALAFGLVASGDWGSDSDPAPILDWSYRVKQELGEKLRWRSEAERERFRLDQALSKHLRPPALSDFVQSNEWASFRAAVRQIALAHRASPAEVEELKSVANPAWDPLGEADSWKQQGLKMECLIALVAAGAGRDPFVLNRLESLAMDYLAEPIRFDASPFGLLALVALGDEAAVPTLRLALGRATSWSIRIACLHGLPESRKDGNYALIEEFRKWMEQANEPSGPQYPYEWKAWRLFMSCLTLDGLVRLCGQDRVRLPAPMAQGSPFIDWVSQRGLDTGLMNEAKWLRQRGLRGEEAPIRNRMVERLVPGVVEFCMERVRTSGHEDDAHYDVDSLLRLHPKPLSKAALDACAEVVRLQCHPGHYKERIEALRLLVEGADLKRYPRSEVVELVL